MTTFKFMVIPSMLLQLYTCAWKMKEPTEGLVILLERRMLFLTFLITWLLDDEWPLVQLSYVHVDMFYTTPSSSEGSQSSPPTQKHPACFWWTNNHFEIENDLCRFSNRGKNVILVRPVHSHHQSQSVIWKLYGGRLLHQFVDKPSDIHARSLHLLRINHMFGPFCDMPACVSIPYVGIQ
jgi:hypothetical protein